MFKLFKKHTLALFLLLSALVLSACSSTPEHPESIDINGTWRVTLVGSIIKDNASKPFIEFHHGQTTGNTGCNQFNGDYEHTGTTLSFPRPLAITAMMCAPDLAQHEAQFIQALNRITHFSYSAKHETLKLLDSNNLTLMKLTK